MRVAVAGLWHLGTVTAACCASGGHQVIAFDREKAVVGDLQRGALPVDEPGLAALVDAEVKSGRLRFTADAAELASPDILWVCYDTPVDENDVADSAYVLSCVKQLLSHLSPATLILISSQLPVGSTAQLEREFPQFTFAYSPENLRLGKAIQVFKNPDRVVIGIRGETGKRPLTALFEPFTSRLEWMGIESAEMTKHALNSFLATSVAFINELAGICEKTGADALEVERGLKTDVRIGAQAYLHAGNAFAGGTLARDVSVLLTLGRNYQVPVKLLQGVVESNDLHKLWAQRRLLEIFRDLRGRVIGILGLTYKPGTNTLRRSSAIEMSRWLLAQGAVVHAYDPAVSVLPEDLSSSGIRLMKDAEGVLENTVAVLVATPWPEFQSIPAQSFLSSGGRRIIVLDPGRHLEGVVKQQEGIEYVAIGAGA